MDELGGKSWVPVAYDFIREPVSSNGGFEKHSCGFLRRNSFVTGYEVRHFRATLVGDREYGVVPVGQGQLSDEVQRDDFEGSRVLVRIYGLQRGFRRSIVDFVSLTFATPSYVFGHVASQPWPPVAALYEVYRPCDAWVTIRRWVVKGFDDGSPLL